MTTDSESKNDTESEGKRVDDSARRSVRDRAKGAVAVAGKATNQLRNQLGRLVWLLAVVAAVILAAGAILVALGANRDNTIVSHIVDLGQSIIGPFDDVFTFEDSNRADAQKKELLVNQWLAAIVYLIVGKFAEKVIRP